MVAADTAAVPAAPASVRPFAALAAAADALKPAHPPVERQHTGGAELGVVDAGARRGSTILADAAEALSASPTDGEVRQLLARAADTLDAETRRPQPPQLGGTTTTALTLARRRGGSVAVSDAEHIELGQALRRRLARAGATTGADFDGDRLRVQPTEGC